jgi:predicted DNA-binding protein with PD1-like motif
MAKRPKTQSELISQQIDFVFELSTEANLNQDESKIALYAKMLTDLSAKQAAAEDRERTTVPRAELLDIASALGDIIYNDLRQHLDEETAHVVTDSIVEKLTARIEKPLQ